MIKNKLLLVFFVVSGLIMSCNSNNEAITGGFITIKGVYNLTSPWPAKNVKFSKIEYGKRVEKGVYKLGKDKKYGFTVAPEKEGFYILHSDYNQIPVYVKGNQVFNVSINGGNKYVMTNIPDEENQVLYDYMKLTDTLLYYRTFASVIPVTYKEFFPFYKEFIPKMKAFHKKVNTSNAKFNKLMHAYIDLDIEDQAVYFLQTPRKEHPTTEQIEKMAPFYKDFIDNEVFKTTIILDIPKGIEALRGHDMYYITHVLKIKMGDGPAEPETLEELEAQTEADKADLQRRRIAFFKELDKNMGASVKNDTLKAFYVLEELPRYKSYNKKYADFMKPYRQYIALSDYVKTKVEDFEATIKTTGAGSPGVDFTYKDINGKEVSFADFRGKVVYIDVWATWCAPCKQEIPYLKELEKEFKGKDIQFISISMDKPKHHEKWKKFVEDNELTGIQLFADNAFDSKLAKDYQINSIPRFLLFDKDGLIVNADAIRPSNPDLKGLLEDLLK